MASSGSIGIPSDPDKPDATNAGDIPSGSETPSTFNPPGYEKFPGNKGGPVHGKTHLSTAVIAVIAIVSALLLIFLILTGIRLWYRKRRGRRLRRWASWRKRAKALGVSALDAGKDKEPAISENLIAGNERMTPSELENASDARSGHAHSYLNFQDGFSFDGTQRTERIAQRISGGSSQLSFMSESSQRTLRSNARASTALSAQYLPYVPLQPDIIGHPRLSPIALSPLTPAEQWQSFKPQKENGSTTLSAANSNSRSPTAARFSSSNGSDSDRTLQGGLSDPFADPGSATLVDLSQYDSRSPVSRSDSIAHSSPTLSRSSSLLSTAASKESAMTSVSDSIAGIIDIVKRKFTPSCEDELSITRGDRVCIIRRFSDGWLYAEKTETAEKGFLPQDCLREVDETLPAYLTGKGNYSAYAA